MSGSSPPPAYPSSLFNEYTIAFEGSSVACILFGFYLAVTGKNMFMLRKKSYMKLFWYSAVQLVLTTIYFAISLYAAPSQSLAIFGIVGSYGPDALSPWPAVLVNVVFTLNTWASDAFLLYRCYNVCMANKLAMVLPSLIYLATVGTSIALLVISATPGAVYSTHAVQVVGITYWSCSVATTACASSIISAQLWKHRQAITQAVGSTQGTFYLGYIAMTLESAVLYTAFVIIALVVFSINSPLENVFFPVLGTVQSIVPSLIIYRIVNGISFDTDEHGSIVTGSLHFASSQRPRAIVRPLHDLTGISSTRQGISDDGANKHESNSLILEMEDKV